MNPYPIDLGVIVCRLRNRYHRSITSLKWDFGQIYKNCANFNEEGSDIVKDALSLSQECINLIRQSGKQDNNDNNNTTIVSISSSPVHHDGDETRPSSSNYMMDNLVGINNSNTHALGLCHNNVDMGSNSGGNRNIGLIDTINYNNNNSDNNSHNNNNDINSNVFDGNTINVNNNNILSFGHINEQLTQTDIINNNLAVDGPLNNLFNITGNDGIGSSASNIGTISTPNTIYSGLDFSNINITTIQPTITTTTTTTTTATTTTTTTTNSNGISSAYSEASDNDDDEDDIGVRKSRRGQRTVIDDDDDDDDDGDNDDDIENKNIAANKLNLSGTTEINNGAKRRKSSIKRPLSRSSSLLADSDSSENDKG
eukprot:Pgem_evm1s2200